MRRGTGRDSPETERRLPEYAVPIAIRGRLPESKWSITRFLEHKELPPHADKDAIAIPPTLSSRGPTESDHFVPRVPVPNDRDWLIALRNRVRRASADGQRSIISPYGGSARFPLWVASFWVDADILNNKRARYHEANAWLQRHRSEISGNLLARVHADWQQFSWSKLNEHLKNPKTGHLPDPDELLKLLSDDWIEDPLMDIMVTLLSLEIERRKLTTVAALGLQFWRELEHLQSTESRFNELHYPALAEARALVLQGKELAFVLSDQNEKNPMGSHWTACVLNVAKGEYHFGDSFNHDPPPSLQPRLELWLHWSGAMPPNQMLYRGTDLDHNSQMDGNSCGFIAVNMLERYIFPRSTKLWTAGSNASLRLVKYINLMEYNGTDRGSPLLSPPNGPAANPGRLRTSSASSARSVSTTASRSTKSSRSSSRAPPDPMFGDIPFEGDDVNHLRGWTPGEGSSMGSRYQAIPPPRSDTSRSRSGSRASSLSREDAPSVPPKEAINNEVSTRRDSPPSIPPPDVTNRGIPIFRAPDTRSNGTAHTTFQLHTPQSSLTKESPPQRPPSVQPIQQRSPTIQRSRPLGVMPAFFRSRPEEPIIPSSEWANTLPPTPVTRLPEERGRRPRPITPPSPSSAGTGIVPPNLLTDSSPDLSGRDIPPIPPTTPWADPPLQPVHNTARPSPPTQGVPFPPSKPPVSIRRKPPHARTPSSNEGLAPPLTKDRTRRGSGSSLSSIWRSFRGRNKDANANINGAANTSTALVPVLQQPPPLTIGPPSNAAPPISMPGMPGTMQPVLLPPPSRDEASGPSDISDARSRSPSPSPMERPRTLSQSSAVSSALSSGTEDRGRSETAPSVRSRKSSMKSVERGSAPRVPGLKVNFLSTEDAPHTGKTSRNITQLDVKREGDTIRKVRGTTPPGTPVLRGKKRSQYPAREGMNTPPHFNLNDPSWPVLRQQQAIEKRFDVIIDTEPNRLVVYGTRNGVSAAVRELYDMFREFQDRNQTQSFQVSERAAHRIGLWAICQRLQNETKMRIVVQQDTSTITITGPKHLLGEAYRRIMTFAAAVDDEKHTHYLVPSSRDLRRVLLIELPRLIAAAGGPDDEEEARQMFTISAPGEGQTGYEMVVDLWCHPTMSTQLTAGLRNTVEQFTQYRAREVWGIRVSPWKLHALKNSHVFRRWDDPVNAPEGTEIPTLHTLEKRLNVNFLFPDEVDRPSWDSLAVRNMPNISKEYLVKIRGVQAQLSAAINELEDRVRRLLQVAVRVPATFHKELRSSRVARRLAKLGVDADIKEPSGDYFECTLSAMRQQDLDSGQTEISRMASRIAKGQPAVERDPRADPSGDEGEQPPPPESRPALTRRPTGPPERVRERTR